jgi:hypothetical protein
MLVELQLNIAAIGLNANAKKKKSSQNLQMMLI